KIDVQVIAATNRDLEAEVAAGRFREDLYYRLNMVELEVPPLRSRIDDLPYFIDYFTQKFATKYNRTVWKPTEEQLHQFREYAWPGNIRQLGHIIEQAYVLDCEPTLPTSRQTCSSEPSLPFTDLARLRQVAVRQALRATRGHKGRAARMLGIHPNTMTRLLAQIEKESQGEVVG